MAAAAKVVAWAQHCLPTCLGSGSSRRPRRSWREGRGSRGCLDLEAGCRIVQQWLRQWQRVRLFRQWTLYRAFGHQLLQEEHGSTAGQTLRQDMWKSYQQSLILRALKCCDSGDVALTT